MGRRSRQNSLPGDSPEHYTAICWRYHDRCCVVCGEARIVAAHHHNGKHWDNRPENFVPLCPTHHAYWHSHHRHLIDEVVNEYVTGFVENCVKYQDDANE